MASRIQRRRSRGWTMPAGAVYVGRPTKWGNPFALVPTSDREARRAAHATSVARYRRYLDAKPALRAAAVRELRGKDLVCWCPLDFPCHADVLLEIANQQAATSSRRERS